MAGALASRPVDSTNVIDTGLSALRVSLACCSNRDWYKFGSMLVLFQLGIILNWLPSLSRHCGLAEADNICVKLASKSSSLAMGLLALNCIWLCNSPSAAADIRLKLAVSYESMGKLSCQWLLRRPVLMVSSPRALGHQRPNKVWLKGRLMAA